jgi:hypothetical protein
MIILVRMSNAAKIDAWCKGAASLEMRLLDAARDFKHLAETNESMSDMAGPLNAAKARIDQSFSGVVAAKNALCR